MEFLSYFLKAFIKAESQKRQAEATKLDAINEIKEKLKAVVDAGDDRSESMYLIELGNVYTYYSEFDLSDTMYRQGLAIARAVGDQHLEIVALANLGLSYKTRLDYSQAYNYYQKALIIARKTDDRNFQTEILKLMDELEKMIGLDQSSGNGNDSTARS